MIPESDDRFRSTPPGMPQPLNPTWVDQQRLVITTWSGVEVLWAANHDLYSVFRPTLWEFLTFPAHQHVLQRTGSLTALAMMGDLLLACGHTYANTYRQWSFSRWAHTPRARYDRVLITAAHYLIDTLVHTFRQAEHHGQVVAQRLDACDLRDRSDHDRAVIHLARLPGRNVTALLSYLDIWQASQSAGA